MIVWACILWSSTNLITGQTSSLFVVAAMRALLGAFQGAYETVAFSMVADQIPEKNQSVAKSILLSTPLVGGGMTAMNIMLIGAVGWRNTV